MASRPLTVAFAAGLAALACTRNAPAQPLTGAERTRAVAGLVKGCLAEAEGDASLAKLNIPAYCQCYAEAIARRATVQDIDAVDSPETEAIVQQAAKACYGKARPTR